MTREEAHAECERAICDAEARREPLPLPRSRAHENDKERAGRERAEEERFDYLKDEGMLRRR
jgi:hypothetical protein